MYNIHSSIYYTYCNHVYWQSHWYLCFQFKTAGFILVIECSYLSILSLTGRIVALLFLVYLLTWWILMHTNPLPLCLPSSPMWMFSLPAPCTPHYAPSGAAAPTCWDTSTWAPPQPLGLWDPRPRCTAAPVFSAEPCIHLARATPGNRRPSHSLRLWHCTGPHPWVFTLLSLLRVPCVWTPFTPCSESHLSYKDAIFPLTRPQHPMCDRPPCLAPPKTSGLSCSGKDGRGKGRESHILSKLFPLAKSFPLTSRRWAICPSQ